jgi:multisubunit Na+/H+ antiporter MnhG subunit
MYVTSQHTKKSPLTFGSVGCASTILNIAAVILATHCTVQAPGLQLLGPEGSTNRAVQLLTRWHVYTLWCHNLGILFFLLALIDMGWMQFTTLDAVTMTVQLALVAVVTVYAIAKMEHEFAYSTEATLNSEGEMRQMDARGDF